MREKLYTELTSRPEIRFAVAHVDVPTIDEINILQASYRAMNLALAQLHPAPEHALVDALRVKVMSLSYTSLALGEILTSP
jgi:ribonuclease HII